MKKIIFGLMSGILLSACVAYAREVQVSGLIWVEEIRANHVLINKFYDQDANVICYTGWESSHGGISCLKNN